MTVYLVEARRLLDLARADQKAFDWLLKGPGLRLASAFFFAQQSIEKALKALKAVMLIKGLVPSRTHNLLALAAELFAAGIPTAVSPDELAVLNPYAVTFRYDDEDISTVEPIEAQRLVEAILNWADELLNREA